MTATEHILCTPSSVEKQPSTLIRVFLGMLAGAAVGAASHAAVIETQVRFLGTQLQAATLDLPSWLATYPRFYYRDIPNLLVLPLIVGGLAGALFRRPAFLRIVSVSLLLALPLLIAFSGHLLCHLTRWCHVDETKARDLSAQRRN
jgi:hypothetical protein